MHQYTHIGLFEGIGGFMYAAKQLNIKSLAWCEIDEFCKTVLRYHYPEVIGHSNIINSNFLPYANRVDIVSGGFPCQPYSTAGKRLGTNDPRHLWPQMLRAIRQIQPSWVVAENVFGLVNWSEGLVFNEVQTDLENTGYQVQSYILPAAGVNAPHKRERVFIVAYSNHFANKRRSKKIKITQQTKGLQKRYKIQQPYIANFLRSRNNKLHSTNTHFNTNKPSTQSFKFSTKRCNNFKLSQKRRKAAKLNTRFNFIQWYAFNPKRKRWVAKHNEKRELKKPQQKKCTKQQFSRANSTFNQWRKFPTQPPICNRNDGFSGKLHNITFSKWSQQTIKAMGNAVVPQIAYQIFNSIIQYSKT